MFNNIFMFTMFTMFIYITIMIRSFYILLIFSGLCIAFNACSSAKSTKSTKSDKEQEIEQEKREEAFDENYDRHH